MKNVFYVILILIKKMNAFYVMMVILFQMMRWIEPNVQNVKLKDAKNAQEIWENKNVLNAKIIHFIIMEK